MNPRLATLLAAPLLAAVAVAAPALLAELRVQPDQNHVVASRLIGTWEPDVGLGEHLGTKAGFERLEFVEDDSVLPAIPGEMAEALAEMRIWQAGVMIATRAGKTTRSPFVLVTHTGNTLVFTFRSTAGGELDDGEANLVTLVPARDGAHDLLFLGGDFNNEPFRAFQRIPQSR